MDCAIKIILCGIKDNFFEFDSELEENCSEELKDEYKFNDSGFEVVNEIINYTIQLRNNEIYYEMERSNQNAVITTSKQINRRKDDEYLLWLFQTASNSSCISAEKLNFFEEGFDHQEHEKVQVKLFYYFYRETEDIIEIQKTKALEDEKGMFRNDNARWQELEVGLQKLADEFLAKRSILLKTCSDPSEFQTHLISPDVSLDSQYLDSTSSNELQIHTYLANKQRESSLSDCFQNYQRALRAVSYSIDNWKLNRIKIGQLFKKVAPKPSDNLATKWLEVFERDAQLKRCIIRSLEMVMEITRCLLEAPDILMNPTLLPVYQELARRILWNVETLKNIQMYIESNKFFPGGLLKKILGGIKIEFDLDLSNAVGRIVRDFKDEGLELGRLKDQLVLFD